MLSTRRVCSLTVVLCAAHGAALAQDCGPFPSNDKRNGNGCINNCVKPNEAPIIEALNFEIQLAIVQGPQICLDNDDCPAGETCMDDALINPPPPPKVVPGHCTPKVDKINRFQEGVRHALFKRGIAIEKIKGVNTLQQAIAAIDADWMAKGEVPIDVAIFGHGGPGQIKVGEDLLTPNSENYDKFVQAVVGKIKSLTLYGCNVATNAEGQKLLNDLSEDLAAGPAAVPVKAWTGTVFAVPNDNIFPAAERGKLLVYAGKKKDAPVLSQWGRGAILLSTMAVGAIVLIRRRWGPQAADSSTTSPQGC
jgi:hypothetical protein